MQSQTNQLPLRGSDAVEILLNDHQVIKGLLTNLVQSKQTQVRQETLEQLKAALTIHNATEENLVYPALQVVAGEKSESKHLYEETAAADVLIFELDTLLKKGDDAGFSEKAEMLRDAVLEHIDDEEKKAFPDLRKQSDPQQSAMLTESVREFRSSLRYEAAT